MKLIVWSLILAVGATLFSNVEAVGTSRCYNCFAIDSCKNITTQKCPDSNKNFGCISAKFATSGLYQIIQGCTPIGSLEIKMLCEAVKAMEGGSCQICNTDLCNTI